MNKKWIITLMVIMALAVTGVIATTAVLLSSGPNNEAPMSFNGAWSANINDSKMHAIITGGTIEINWVNNDVQALYWKGTFPTPLNAKVGDTFDILSTGDTDTMGTSLMASQDTTKMFTYKDHKLHFKLTVMGVQTTVHLEKGTNDV